METTHQTLNKVARITVYFWMMKVLATTPVRCWVISFP